MKTVVVGVSKVLMVIIFLVLALVAVVMLWFTFGIRPFDRVSARVVAMTKTDPDKALEMYPEVFAELDKQKMSPEDRGMTYSRYGHFLKDHGRNQEAIDNLNKAIQFSAKGWRGITKACAILDIAECRLGMEDAKEIDKSDIDNLLQAASLHPPRESGDDKWFWPAYDQALGRMYAATGDFSQAFPALDKALAEYKALDAYPSEVGSQGLIIDALIRQGKYVEANKKFVEGTRDIADQNDAYQLRTIFRDSLGRAQDKDPGFRKRVLGMLAAKKFAELDKLADDMLATKRIMPSGRWYVDDLYRAFDALKETQFDADWRAQIDLQQQWVKARPDSSTAKIALARVLGSYAWRARGGGYSDTVKEGGWKLFEERLASAMTMLEQVKDKPALWYMPAQRCALGQGWDRAKYDAMVAECRKRYPDYDSVVFTKGYFLQPRWHGEEGEYEKFTASEADKRPGPKGDMLYARSAWYIDDQIGGVMDQTKLSWPRVRSGFSENIKEFPQSLLSKGMLSVLALEANDEKTALSAFDTSSK